MTAAATSYAVLAETIWCVHVAYVAFVVLGQAAIIIGAIQGWAWIRYTWLRVVHMAAISLVAAESALNMPCALTVWQDRLLVRAGQPARGFRVIPFGIHVSDASWNAIYILFALLVLTTVIVVPPRRTRTVEASRLAAPDGAELSSRLFQVIFWIVQLSVVGLLFVPFRWQLVGVWAASHVMRGTGLTLAFHRYYAHRSFQMSRSARFVWTFLGTSAMQKGPLWWAGHHVIHHRHADRDGDPHSPKLGGLYHAHMGWFLRDLRHRVDPGDPVVREFSRYGEIRFLERHCMLPPVVWGAAMYALGGLPWLAWGFCLSTVTVAHSTFAINTVNHLLGSRRFNTPDGSRNNIVTAVLGLGEGWHNNHHRYQSAARNGFYWWEVDLTYYVIRSMELLGFAWGVQPVPAHVYAEAAAGGTALSAPAIDSSE